MGEAVRYNGLALPIEDSPIFEQWRKEGRLISICPEMAAGLTAPRPPSEIIEGNGDDVIAGKARVLTNTQSDVTEAHLLGAQITLQMARQHHCRIAILSERSPSCGSETIYDGRFSGQLQPGSGVTAALLRQNGIQVFSQFRLNEAAICLQQLEKTASAFSG